MDKDLDQEKLESHDKMSMDSSDSNDSFRNDLDQYILLDNVDIMKQNEIVHEKRFRKSDKDLDNLQKVDIYVQQLPYFDKIKINAFSAFEEIKLNITEALAVNELRPGFVHWSNRLIIFIHEYGLFFTKEEHIRLIKLYISVMLTPDVDLPTVDICFNVLVELLKKFEKISRKELSIEWRPIYNLYLRIHKIDDYSADLAPESIESNGFFNFIRLARIYFDVNSTKEMLETWRVLMCPFDSEMSTAFERLKLFLPTIMYEEEAEHGYKLWLVEFLNLWTSFNSRNFWEPHMLSIFNRVANDNIGEFDWNPYIPFIFSNVLRGFGLPFGSKDSIALGVSNLSNAAINNNISQISVYSNESIHTMASWIVAMIGCGQDRNLCMQHIKKLFEALRSFYYPSNSGSWSTNLFLFLKSLPEMFIKRIKKERRENHKWYHKTVKHETVINDQDIKSFVDALKDTVFTAIFSRSHHSEAKKAFQYLTFLSGETMFPPLIEKINMSLESLVEPHRYTSILSCLVSVARELATYNPNHLVQTQIHVIPLMCAVLPGLDPNDSHKCILTLQFISNLLNCLILCDCSPAPNYRNDLSDSERELCYETSKFEDFLHEFFKKIFGIVDNLASDTSCESSASAAAASSYFAVNGRIKHTDENAYQAQIIQTIRVLIRQSSKSYLKLILNKLKNYINGNTYNTRSGRIIANIAGYLASSGYGKVAFETLFNYVYENLVKIKESKNHESILKDERGDIEVTWNLQLFAELLKANGLILLEHMPRISQIMTWYRSTIHKESVSYMSCCFRNIIVALTHIYSTEFCSVSYSIIFDDEKEFFSKHLPIRDWACTGDLFKLNINYHIPSVKEIEAALEFVESSLNKSVEFLTNSILSSTNDEALTSSTKEERNRELNFINHIMYGASRLLKRPANRSYINDHIDTRVQVGINDELNKGLGFEPANLNNKDHEYSQLSDKHRTIMLQTKENLTNFIISLAEKVFDKHPNETTILMLMCRILSTVSVTYGYFVNDFEKMWKNHYTNKASLQNKLLGKKNSLREELIQRVMLQYQFRTFHLHTKLNDLDLKIINLLFRLSCDSLYAVVRKDAQSQLFSLLSHYPYSSLILVPKIVDLLNRCSETDETKKISHDQLKGCLYLLKGNNVQDSLIIKQNWNVISAIWPALFKCQDFEKPSIQNLLDKIYMKANKDYDSFDNRARLTDTTLNIVYEMNADVKSRYQNNEELRLKYYHEKMINDDKYVEKLMSDLVRIARESQLLWKNQTTSYGAILFLLYPCKFEKSLLSVECVQLFVDSLVHDNINVRKVAIDALCVIQKMVKIKKQTKEYDTVELIRQETNNELNESQITINKPNPGYRQDNKWLFFTPNFINTNMDSVDDDKWNNTKFLDKSYWGYYCWPSKLTVNLNKRDNYTTNVNSGKSGDYNDAVKPLREKFQNDAEFVKKFIKLSIIEESKGNEKFDKKRFYFFKALFRNFGTSDIFNDLYEHLNRLITDKDTQTQECSHKLAAELICGLIRGSKYWPLADLKVLWSKLKPLFDLVMENISTENLKLWYSCFSAAFEDQDPRRLVFYINYFHDLTRRYFSKDAMQKTSDGDPSNATSFQQSSCLHFLNSLGQCEWKIPNFWDSLFETFLAHMSHPYKSVREKIALCTSLCLTKEIDYSVSIERSANKQSIKPTKLENLSKFINFLEVKVNQAIELFDFVSEENIDKEQNGTSSTEKETHNYNSPQHLDAVNFLQSTFYLFSYYIMKSYQPISTEMLRIVPQLCSVDKIAAQEVSVKSQLPLMRMFFSMWMLDENCTFLFIDQLEKVSKFKSWHSRLAAMQMLQNFGIFNLFLINDEVKKKLKTIIIDALTDEQLEVRISASLTLTGYIHSKVFEADQDLINHLKSLSKIKARTKDKESGKMITNMPNLIKRHGGVLGMCSIVNSSPYDMPAYLPDTVTYLCQFINDPVPIQGSVRKCLSEFRRTHLDNWQEHKLSFDENQLSILSDILISPNYYA